VPTAEGDGSFGKGRDVQQVDHTRATVGDEVRITIAGRHFAGEVVAVEGPGLAMIELTQGDKLVGPVTYNFGRYVDDDATAVLERRKEVQECGPLRRWYEEFKGLNFWLEEDPNEYGSVSISGSMSGKVLASFLEWVAQTKREAEREGGLLDQCERDYVNREEEDQDEEVEEGSPQSA